MSLPPETIQVKRKRSREGNDSDTPDFLCVERDTKRPRSGLQDDERWVYRLKQAKLKQPGPLQAQGVLPVIQASKPGDENWVTKPKAQPSKPKPHPQADETAKPIHSAASAEAILAPLSRVGSRDNVRRFHLARSSTPPDMGKVLMGGVSKKRSAAALFVERGRKTRSGPDLKSSWEDSKTSAPSTTVDIPAVMELLSLEKQDVGENGDQESLRKLKRPGAAARITKKSTVPPSMVDREQADLDQLAKKMHEYTLEQIDRDLEEARQRDAKEARAQENAARRRKLRPKAPLQRFAERNPEYVARWEQERAQTAATDRDATMAEDVSDDDDYVLETYVRVPASHVPTNVAPHQVGLLVFDTEPDVDFFYGDDEEEEYEDPDEDDENAEDFYGADYPEDEMDFSDEMGMDSEKFHSRNSAEYEAFDARDWDSS